MTVLSDLTLNVRRKLAEPTDGRFFEDDEIVQWVNEALRDMSTDLRCFKKSTTILGSAYIGSPASGDTYRYELPTDFLWLDKSRGIKINGLRVKGATQQEIDAMQEKDLAGATNNEIIYAEDYYTEVYTDLTFCYTVDYIMLDEIDAGRSGKVGFFLPNPQATDSIVIYYIAKHPTLSSDTDTVYIDQQFEPLVIASAAYKGASKMNAAGFVPMTFVDLMFKEYDYYNNKAKTYYTEAKKQPDRRPKIKTGKQVFGLYNSVGRNRYNRYRYNSEY